MPAVGLQFEDNIFETLGDPNPSIPVNSRLSFSVQTMTYDLANPSSLVPLEDGRHSTLTIDLSVSWDYKRFYMTFPANFNQNELLHSQYQLGGTGTSLNGLFDTVIRKKAVQGLATFDDVRILNEGADVRLNFTQTQSHFPWERRPAVYDPIIRSSKVGDVNTIWTYSNETTSPAVLLTRSFSVIGIYNTF